MEDLPKSILLNFFEESIDKAKKLLQEKYSAVQINNTDDDFPINLNPKKYEFFKIQIKKNAPPLTFIIALPNHFPDEFPKIFLSKKNYLSIGQIPHIDKNRFICTKEPNTAVLNDKIPDDALDELIKIAIEIINKGIKKENNDDFTEEFLAYWNDQTDYKFLSLFKPHSDIAMEKVILFSKNFKIANIKRNGLIAKDNKEFEKWMKNLELPIDNNNIYNALYLPLSKPIHFPFPKTNGEVFKLIQESNNDNFSALKNYLNQDNNLKIILFSFPVKKERILAGWKISILRGKTMKGFRNGNVPIEAWMTKAAMNQIKTISIERVDQARLFNRGGCGIKSSIINSSIAIVGCGSLGSPIAMSLLKCGISRFFLLDNDTLEPANVARHVCGISDSINIPYKSEALCNKMLKHFPHIECATSKDEILDLLEKNPKYLDKHDISIIAIGNFSVERRLNYLAKKGAIKSPLVFIWMEPFGVAGHMLYLNLASGGCFQCCFDYKKNFKFAVAEHEKKYFKKESGCQSSYIPYSNLEIEGFINSVSKEILICLEKKPQQSYLITWIGNVNDFKSLGYQINDLWAANLNYSIYRTNIFQEKNCELCKSN